jgi:putative hemolysin
MMHLWNGLAEYIAAHGIEVMFGVASFHGTDPRASRGRSVAAASPPSRAAGRAPRRARRRVSGDGPDRRGSARPKAAIRDTPALIKAYLRLGGFVGHGAFIDRPFNCIDVCLVMDVARMSERHKAIYTALLTPLGAGGEPDLGWPAPATAAHSGPMDWLRGCCAGARVSFWRF